MSIPTDDAAKMRVCEYEVLREVPYNFGTGSEHLTEDHLAKTPVWTSDSLFGNHTDIEVGDLVRYIGWENQYNLLDKDAVYRVAHIQEWGGLAYISVDEFPANTIFVLNEFELVEKGYSHDDDEDLVDDEDSSDDWELSDNDPDNDGY